MDHSKQMEFRGRQKNASNELLARIQPCVPRGWQTAELHLEVAYSRATGIRSVQHRLHNPATGEEVLDFPEALFHATTGLHVVFTEYDQAWKHCVLKLTYNRAGALVRSESNFGY